MAEKTRFLRLESIIAYMQTERDGDEIFIKYKGEKIVPEQGKFVKMTREPLPLEVEIAVDENNNWVELELWDYDNFSPNDRLGKFKLLVDEVSEGFTAELQPEKDELARYVLNWSVVERKTPT
jgi:hypothetical protein